MRVVDPAVVKPAPRGSFGAQLKALREAAGFTQEELATIAGLSVHAVSSLERGERRRPHVETVRALSAALDLTGGARDALLGSARAPASGGAAEESSGVPLPLPLTVLLGRDDEVRTLRLWLADPSARLVTLVGPGGVGKTRLALELTRACAEQGTMRVLFVPLATIRDPSFVASAIGEALGLSNVTVLDLPRRAGVACADQATLLVLDNFEQVLDAAPLVADLLTSAASLRLMVTSRAPLHVRGERQFIVGPLALDVKVDAMSPVDPACAPAVRLFVERVRDVLPHFRLTAVNGPTVAAICRRLDALPLALELAAPWLKVLTPEDLFRRLAHDVLPSTIGPRDLPERQRTMNATVAWSYQLLGPGEQHIFRRLGALPGRFGIDAAEAVLAGGEAAAGPGSPDPPNRGALGGIAALIDKSLLQRTEHSLPQRPLYQMLETVRGYAAVELAACGDRDEALEGLARYCTREAACAAEGLMGAAQAEWLNRVRHDLENYRAGMSWLIERGRSVEASQVALALRYFWLIRGHAAEGLQWYEQILDMPALPAAAESRARLGAGVMWFAHGEYERARQALERALALGRSTGEIEIVADAEYAVGHVERAAGNLSAAHDRFQRSLEGFRMLNISSGAGKALNGMATIALAAGDAIQAERLLDEAASALGEDAPWFLCFESWIRALLAVRRGEADEALAWMRDCLERIRQLNDKFASVFALVPLAAAAALKGNDLWAARILGVRDAVAERTGATLVDTSVHDLRVQTERDVRARLGPDGWAQGYAAGRSASIDSLLRDIDATAT
jgi:predicted ATPase/DNA-binding XRE family transcriptional regulator